MLALSHVSLARLNYISQNALSYGMRPQRDSWVIYMEDGKEAAAIWQQMSCHLPTGSPH